MVISGGDVTRAHVLPYVSMSASQSLITDNDISSSPFWKLENASIRGNFGCHSPLSIQGEKEIRKEFGKLDVDNSGFITKGKTRATRADSFLTCLPSV